MEAPPYHFKRAVFVFMVPALWVCIGHNIGIYLHCSIIVVIVGTSIAKLHSSPADKLEA